MKKPKPKARTAAIRARMKPSVKAMAEQLAQKDARSLADWLERLIAAEADAPGHPPLCGPFCRIERTNPS
jgi:predicted HicB family RNase H-like nuclease